jgi:beta-lactamase superfamily II metal-dependent hydrolase
MVTAISPSGVDDSIAEIWFVDVGQGDCTLIVDNESGRGLLIDCHTQNVGMVVDLVRANDISIDTAIVTHWDRDHYGGIARIAEVLPLRRVLYNHDTLFPSPQARAGIKSTLKLFLGLERFGTQLSDAKEGASDDIGSLHWEFLAPSHREITQAIVAGNRNIASAVLLIEIGATSLLVGGDAVAETWRRLLSSGLLHADILRWPHHGADLHEDRTGEVRDRILTQVNPSYVIVSAGTTNTYGHPSSEVIEAASTKATVMCTQVTPACFGHRLREERVSAIGRSSVTGLASPACAGTVRVSVTKSGMAVNPGIEALKERIQQWPHPLCVSD